MAIPGRMKMTTTVGVRALRRRRAWIASGLALLSIATAFAAESDLTKRREQFGQQLFAPADGLVIKSGSPLPPLVWKQPITVAAPVEDPSIRTRWFDAALREVNEAGRAGRYFVYGEASGSGGSVFRRAMTAVVVSRTADLRKLAEEWMPPDSSEPGVAWRARIEGAIQSWRHTEDGAVQLAAMIESGGKPEARLGQWQMENATRHG